MSEDIKALILVDKRIHELVLVNCHVEYGVKIKSCYIGDSVDISENVVGEDIFTEHNIRNVKLREKK
jgi:hypothetical protein